VVGALALGILSMSGLREAQRVAPMLEGHIVETAEVEAFFESPQDPRTAAFVRGEMVY
jgi:ABC-type phosphate transport system ATPase subunit